MDVQPAISPASELLAQAMRKALVCKFRVEGPVGQIAVKLSLGSDEYQVTWSSAISADSAVPRAIDQVAQSALSYLARMADYRENAVTITDVV
jgi:hypothetical protein